MLAACPQIHKLCFLQLSPIYDHYSQRFNGACARNFAYWRTWVLEHTHPSPPFAQ